MNALSRWEDAVERWQDALMDRIRHREPVELVQALQRECDERAVVCSRCRVIAPNAYEIDLPPDVYRKIARHARRIGLQLTDALVRHGENHGYEWAGPLAVRLRPAELEPGSRYRISSAPMPHIRATAFPD
ncbi:MULTISPECIES: DUF3662 domain-containing protein [Streptomyces]|uniref:DUF3662 domain-containing protein n=1 Tax=Streptomyces TaxID=1883 RepID=UPI0022715DDA|nr:MULTISPECIES: DUF3662 domain-containing protein [unclassified Streptomyces]MCY0943108.1 DUF3662 domain-containing protein [Streptomyces sp. H34-AA3]MCY0949714.1 DUF3662 domain-containing protein [Streptomyces sp. H27-S2]MCZ4087735.1 DUF3662 domain-containing protein [Streptomyces sp. H34-S5]